MFENGCGTKISGLENGWFLETRVQQKSLVPADVLGAAVQAGAASSRLFELY